LGTAGFFMLKTAQTDAYLSSNTPLCVYQHMRMCWLRHAYVFCFPSKSLKKEINNDHFTNMVTSGFSILPLKGASKGFWLFLFRRERKKIQLFFSEAIVITLNALRVFQFCTCVYTELHPA
jgi:hypothetical protein